MIILFIILAAFFVYSFPGPINMALAFAGAYAGHHNGLGVVKATQVYLRPSLGCDILSRGSLGMDADTGYRVLRPLAVGERFKGKDTKTRSYPRRLKNVDPYMMSLLDEHSHSTLVIDVGAGWSPDPSIEFADKIANTHPRVHVIAMDINFPAMVIETNFAPPGLNSAVTVILNQQGDLIAINGLPFSFTGEQLQKTRPEAFESLTKIRDELIKKLKQEGGMLVVDENNNRLIVDPLSGAKFQRHNITYLAEDILQSTVQAGTVDIIRDFNMTVLYYTEPKERQAVLEAEGQLLKEGGHMLVGSSSALSQNEEYVDYRKTGDAIKPEKFIFSIDPTLKRVEHPGTESGVSDSYFKDNPQLYEDYMRTIISMLPEDRRAEGFDYFSNMNDRDPNYYTNFIREVVARLHEKGYDASVVPGNSIALRYQKNGLLKTAPVKNLGAVSKRAISQIEQSI